MLIRLPVRPLLAALALAAAALPAARAWDLQGHRLVNQLALASLPADFPTFVREPANAERIAFLAGEPDRWRNVPDLPLKQSGGSWTDHFLDWEQIPAAGLTADQLPSFRYDFIVLFAAGRAAHPQNFPVIDPAKNLDHTREWPGFAPWAIAEWFGRLRSAFSYLRVFEELGTPEEIANARANVVYLMGVMGHYVGDVAQPLHTTDNFNGWVGPNPQGYTAWNGIHSWIDGGLLAKAGVQLGDLAPRVGAAEALAVAPRADGRDPIFVAALDYLLAQHEKVVPIYELEKAGKLSHGKDEPVHPEGRALIEGQLLAGGAMLGRIWTTAWRHAVPDVYLRSTLVRRQAKAAASAP